MKQITYKEFKELPLHTTFVIVWQWEETVYADTLQLLEDGLYAYVCTNSGTVEDGEATPFDVQYCEILKTSPTFYVAT